MKGDSLEDITINILALEKLREFFEKNSLFLRDF